MGWKLLMMNCPGVRMWADVSFVFVFIFMLHFANGATNPTDVAAINSLYAALGSPKLPGWVAAAGDPCGDAWQGVLCDTSNIISISLVGADLGGELGDSIGLFTSIQSIDLSNNHIGGSVPSSLPASLVTFLISDNNLTGSIPSTISTLPALTTLDLAHNGFSGELPPSMESLSSLVSLHLQDNQLSGTLDVLQDLPLQDLNIANNQFSGPIPDKLLSIPSFKSDGNLFNTSAAPVSAPPAPSTPPSPFFPGGPTQTPPRSGTTSPSSGTISSNSTSQSSGTASSNSSTTSGSGQRPRTHAASPSTHQDSNTVKKTQSSKTKRIVGISIASVIGFIILVLALLLCLPWCFSRSKDYYRTTKRHEIQPYMGPREYPPLHNGPSRQPNNLAEKAQKDAVVEIKDESRAGVRTTAAIAKQQSEGEIYSQRSTVPLRKLDSDMSFSDIDFMINPPPPPPPPPPLPFSSEKVIVKPIPSTGYVSAKPSTRPLPMTSVKSFTIASLQQYTNSFSQDNLLGSGMLGTVYRAELPNGKLLAVKKLDKGISSRLKDHEFLELVNDIDRIRHVNVVELVGYCSEHSQRLLIYEYCSNGTLQESLHSDDEYRKKLSWNMRIQMTLGTARALEYLHEVCEPPVVHRNFKSGNILLDDELQVRVSDCGLASLIASGSVSQLSGHLLSAYGYGAPEFELGIYTSQSDVYSFGVVMLELLTGRMSYDRTRVRGEQFLVRWAVPQLHDIDALQRMVDPSLNRKYPTKSLSHFADIISRCVQSQPEFRPLMSEVVQDLQHLLQRGSPTKSPYGD
ncbi:protein STRUBBELIG-RECEPTOR FAMILY 3 isoform X2 [Spinacia oleracea]|uniref:Protein STRUBBELIG-RECEPTOR FAMILY 3 isoform X2 n=1 Tax=Spinacia oleracea TaxID=3562 RepID=A0A9R0K3Z9_SPIOL|nr:protein STRUBBELIG-RECEPTOR FAMILY 3 isoform X2 [Spinacia oleracea]